MISDSSSSQLIHQLQFYQLLVDSVQDYAIFMLNADGTIASWNKGAQKLKGYEPYEIIGRHFSIFYTPEDMERNKPARELEQCTTFGRIEDEYWRVRKDGTRFWANVVITALYDDEGGHIGYAKVTRDLTSRKQHEVMLEKANKALRQQQKELKLLNAAKDEFIAIASHQLRTPATSVKQYLGMIKEGYAGEIDEKQQLFVDKAYESNDRQIDLINNLLRVAQVDAGKVVLQREQADVSELLLGIVDDLAGGARQRHQSFKLVLPENTVTAYIDKTRFRMILENIIDNAIKYTEEGGSITVSAINNRAGCRIEITDTGVGIDKASIDRLFTKFSRIQNSLSSVSNGSGLGLYWVKKIVDLHEGSVKAASRPGEGTTFTIQVPKHSI